MTQELKERIERKMNRREKPTLLIVEDHEELREHYRELFGDYFQTFDSGKGEEALRGRMHRARIGTRGATVNRGLRALWPTRWRLCHCSTVTSLRPMGPAP